MIFRKLRIVTGNEWRFIILIILMFASLLITFGVQKYSFTAFSSFFKMISSFFNVTFTSVPFFNVTFTSHENASSGNHHMTENLLNETITTTTKTSSPATEARTSSTVEITKKSHKGCDTKITLVSAFLYIGDHQKGGGKRNMAEYFEWSKAFGFIWNMLYFYTDSPMFAEHLLKVRSSLNDSLTHIIHINRSSLWPFKLRDTIARLYQDRNYPKHHPNTVVPEYSCSMHSKYACVENAIINRSEEVTTTYYAWIDIGYFRSLNDKMNYCVILPTGYSSDKVMFNQVYNPNFDLTPKQIHYGNHVWVGGGMFIAARDTMLRFCSEYRHAVEFFLFSRNLSSTDQQCLYSSYTKSGRMDVNMTVELQVFQGNGDWFKLGTSSLRRIDF